MSLLQQMADVLEANGATLVASDAQQRIIFWGRGAERLFGIPREAALNRACPEVVEGRDLFGNRYCNHSCPVTRMLNRGESVSPFAMQLGENRTPMTCTVVGVPEPATAREGHICLFRPLQAHGAALPVVEPAHLPPQESRVVPQESPGEGGNGRNPLTLREREILQLIAESVDTPSIAGQLSISQTTVRNHVQNIFRKLDVHSKLEAVLYAQRHCLL